MAARAIHLYHPSGDLMILSGRSVGIGRVPKGYLPLSFPDVESWYRRGQLHPGALFELHRLATGRSLARPPAPDHERELLREVQAALGDGRLLAYRRVATTKPQAIVSMASLAEKARELGERAARSAAGKLPGFAGTASSLSGATRTLGGAAGRVASAADGLASAAGDAASAAGRAASAVRSTFGRG
ncbi:MAG: hypothetical protein KIT72_08065 [Polyangiaceae bacterium]|nr:hypothetical protein [Polyangiaceae bacterium]MCW5790361.1 hypothetical protein [Polyangiaceae bacterium]